MAWAAVQLQASPRLELFGNVLWTSGVASIYGLNYEPGALKPVLGGLDYQLMSATYSGFSNLKVRQGVQGIGANYRLSQALVLQGSLELNQYDDRDPYLFDATGRYVTFSAGLNWLF